MWQQKGKCETVYERSGSAPVNNSENVKASDSTSSILRGLALGVVEGGRYSNHGVARVVVSKDVETENRVILT